MTVTSDVRPRAAELLKQIGPDMYREAYSRGMSFSAYLETIDPSDEYKDGLDSFSRMLKLAQIRTRSVPEAGFFADRFDAFEKNDNTRSLVPEWMARQWRRVNASGTRGIYTSTDETLNTTLHPYVDATAIRASRQLAPAIPLSELVALTTPIDSDAYRAYYLTDSAAELRMLRVSQGAEVPKAKLSGGERMINLYKYGRSLEATYEMLRRMPIDKVAFHIQRMAIQSESDKVSTVLDVLVNGDGNANTAAETFNLTTLDAAAVAGTLTLKAWLAFKMKFANPYMITHALATEAIAQQMMLLNTGSANVPLVMTQAASGFGSFVPINQGLADGVRLGWTTDAPSNQIVGFDGRLAVERVVEIGANIQEIERYTTRQTQVLTMTEVEGYACFDLEAAKVLVVNA